MKYKLKCTVSHGICYNGGVRVYEDFVDVDFSPEEVERIRSVVTSEGKQPACKQIEAKLPAIHQKIEKCSFDYKVYTTIVDACIRWDDGLDGVYEKDLVQEDIDSGQFKPLYVREGVNEPDAMITYEWFIWLLNKIKDLPYRKRSEYLMKRYKIDFYPEELDFVTSYSLPKEICEIA